MFARWSTLLAAVFTSGRRLGTHAEERSRMNEWISYVHHDWDDVDRLYVDHESIGG